MTNTMFATANVLTASRRSGWAPGIDLRLLAEPSRGIFGILDGVGPTYGGHHDPIALDPALDALSEVLLRSGATGLRTAIVSAHRTASALQPAARLSHTGVGVTVAVVDDRVLHVAQVGMSRIYRRRAGDVSLMIWDHSVPSEALRRHGAESSDYLDALCFHRTAVTRMLGVAAEAEADYLAEPLANGDRFLICSGGIWNHDEGDRQVRALFDTDSASFGATMVSSGSTVDVAALRFCVEEATATS